MPDCLIAPVRTEHLPSAFAVAEGKGKVQFGASDKALFDRLEGRKGTLPVFVFPAGPAVPAYPREQVCMHGVLLGASETEDPEIRPVSTREDTPWPVYWTLGLSGTLARPLAITDFLTKDGARHQRTPRRPMIATIDL
jgi:hypothetical protein